LTNNYMGNYIEVSKYARWLDEENRRETWEETVQRYMYNVVQPNVDDADLWVEINNAILNKEVMPSMRMLMTAGTALERDHMAGYNCSYIDLDHPRAFDEMMYILTCGTGIGFGVEQRAINKLPEVAEEFHDTDTTIVVSDSRIGWASAFRELLAMLWAGKVPTIDVSRVRGPGERLKTFGGRASGPAPLVDLFNYCVRTFRNAAGRKLTDLECHGIACKIGDIVVVGGVRRSALISLSDLASARMRSAKSGLWWEGHPEYALANNSAVYNEKPTTGEFLTEWTSLYESKSGERGIYFREGIRNKTRRIGRRDDELIVGTNPCGEIALRSAGLCNLTEVVVRADDTAETLKRKVELATILGTIQSTFTDFRYVRSVWKRNAEEERLLGVSLTGIYDNPITYSGAGLGELLERLRDTARGTNREWASKLGINPSAAITTVKPSGTVSQLVDSASGIHTRHSPYYIRSVRQDNKDPLTAFMKAAGIPNEPAFGKEDTTSVFYFPMKSPDGAVCRDDITAVDHLELWKIYNEHWAEHQVSITVSVDEDEWMRAGAWVYDNFDHLSGVSFLPKDGGSYKQAPYQECTKEEYEAYVTRMPEAIDWSQLSLFESEDTTSGTQQLACTAGACEIL